MLEKLKTRKATGIFAILSFLVGVLFSGKKFTGNIIALKTPYYINTLNSIGVLLLVCSLILIHYTIGKK